jgi:hypothetical protein
MTKIDLSNIPQSVSVLKKIQVNPKTREQSRLATKALRLLNLAELQKAVAKFDEGTAQIMELTETLLDLEVSIEKSPPFGDALKRVGSILAQANSVFSQLNQAEGLPTVAVTDRLASVPADEKPDTPPPAPAVVTNEPEIGKLSERYESRGDAGAVGEDIKGGPSYGKYQIATKTGTMKRFLSFLAKTNPGLAQKLEASGGNQGALQRTSTFEKAWKELARKDPAFADAQHSFIQATHYDPFVKKAKRDNNLEVQSRSMALKNVTWSVAVQHGADNNVFKNALQNKNPPAMDDTQVINAVYDERSKVDKYFSSSKDGVKRSVKERFAKERSEALAMLQKEQQA